MDTVEHQLFILVQLLEKAEEARIAGRLDMTKYALLTMRRLLFEIYPLPFHTLN